MLYIYGIRHFGRADVVEGVGHVTCRFLHFMFVPILPSETVFLTEDDLEMKLPFSFKAAISGWMRGGAILIGLVLLTAGIANFTNGESLIGLGSMVFAILAFASFPLLGVLFGRCSEARIAELRSKLIEANSTAAIPPAPESALAQNAQPSVTSSPSSTP